MKWYQIGVVQLLIFREKEKERGEKGFHTHVKDAYTMP